MIHVRRHIRITASGKRASVRAHERAGDDGLRPVPEDYRPPYVGDLTPVADERGTSPEFRDMFLADGVDEDWWDDEPDAAVADGQGTSPEFRRLFLGE